MPAELINDPMQLLQYLKSASNGGCSWGEVNEVVQARFTPHAVAAIIAQKGSVENLQLLFQSLNGEGQAMQLKRLIGLDLVGDNGSMGRINSARVSPETGLFHATIGSQDREIVATEINVTTGASSSRQWARASLLPEPLQSSQYIAVSAFGAWSPNVPLGMVGIYATLNGERGAPRTCWLVPKDEYRACNDAFVIDPTRHIRLPQTVEFGVGAQLSEQIPGTIAEVCDTGQNQPAFFTFKIGDVVCFTNDYGAAWHGRRIVEQVVDPDRGRCYHLEPTDTPWFPQSEASLSMETLNRHELEACRQSDGGLDRFVTANANYLDEISTKIASFLAGRGLADSQYSGDSPTL